MIAVRMEMIPDMYGIGMDMRGGSSTGKARYG